MIAKKSFSEVRNRHLRDINLFLGGLGIGDGHFGEEVGIGGNMMKIDYRQIHSINFK
jgi:hypothetical protein